MIMLTIADENQQSTMATIEAMMATGRPISVFCSRFVTHSSTINHNKIIM